MANQPIPEVNDEPEDEPARNEPDEPEPNEPDEPELNEPEPEPEVLKFTKTDSRAEAASNEQQPTLKERERDLQEAATSATLITQQKATTSLDQLVLPCAASAFAGALIGMASSASLFTVLRKRRF